MTPYAACNDAKHAFAVAARRADGCCACHLRSGGAVRLSRPGCRSAQTHSLDTLYKGVFTFGTDQPVYPPWYMGDNPENGEGFESAVAYAVAAKFGYPREDVRWVRVPFNAALAPGAKEFDASLSEFSITDQRKAAVDFSTPYFDVTQAVVTVQVVTGRRRCAASNALKPLRLGVQVGTTSYTAATSVGGANPVAVYNTNVDAKMALSNGEIEALVADLPTAFAVANELRDGVIVGQLPAGHRRCRAVRHRLEQRQFAHPLRVLGRRRTSR